MNLTIVERAEQQFNDLVRARLADDPSSALFARSGGDPLVDVNRMKSDLIPIRGDDSQIAEYFNAATAEHGDMRRSAKNFLATILYGTLDDEEQKELAEWLDSYDDSVTVAPNGLSLKAAKSFVGYKGTGRWLVNVLWLTWFLSDVDDEIPEDTLKRAATMV